MAGCKIQAFEQPGGRGTAIAAADDPSSRLSPEEKADKILASMSQTEKVGQLMMIGIAGKTVDEDVLYQLRQFHFGGIVLFDRNMESPEQVRSLTGALQKRGGEKLPLFIAIDEEGGEVARMRESLTSPPPQSEIGASGETALAKEWAEKTAKNLRAIGVNVNFAPVADLSLALGRSYSEEAETAAEFVAAAAKGYEKEKFCYTLKHFPSMGKGEEDPHEDSVVVDLSKEELASEDLIPFRRIIAEKPEGNYMVMVSHVSYPQLSGSLPASVSPAIIKNLLRGEMNYRGVVVTDDMEMGAVSKHYGFSELGVKAIEAGADIVLVCHDYAHEQEVYLGMLEAVKDGRLSEERLNESVRRIIKLKSYLSGRT